MQGACAVHSNCSLHTLPVPSLCLSLLALAALTASSLQECCSSSDTAGPQILWSPNELFCDPGGKLAKEAGGACRAIILLDEPELIQLLLLCKLGAFSPTVIIYCYKLLWSGSQDIVILRDKLNHKRNKLKWIRIRWWWLSSFHWACAVILTSIKVLHFNFCLLRKKLQPSPSELFWSGGKVGKTLFSFSQKQDKPINALTIKPHLEFFVITCQVINQISACHSFHHRGGNFYPFLYCTCEEQCRDWKFTAEIFNVEVSMI